MRSVLGYLALSAGFAASISAVGWWLLVARRAGGPGATRAARTARVMTWIGLVGAAAACAVLVSALVADDFSVRYVAENGARAVPLYYKVISLWAALEGSLLLWLLVLTAFAVVAMRFAGPGARGRAPEETDDAAQATLAPWALATLSGVAVLFFGLALFAGNAFEPVAPVPADGPGPNPLLQDHPFMGIHPPLLYIGYIGLTVPFAYAIAALVTGRTGRTWVRSTRRWTLVAWTVLTAGIVMGAWWSYEVLGWGGYWAWDPVENASILPWFTATALLHSVMVQERRTALRVWNLSLAVATFVLVLVGTFLTRSGVIASVHAFTQSHVGPILLGFVLLTLLGAGALFVWRGDRLGPVDSLDAPVSREGVFLANNVILVALAFTVLLGTVFPLLVEALSGDQVSVGAPYFNRMAVPLALVMVLLMGVGPLVPWGLAEPRAVLRRLGLPAALGAATIAVAGLAGLRGLAPVLTFGLAVFTAACITLRGLEVISAVQRARGGGWAVATWRALRARRRLYGGLVVHLGVVLAAVAIAASSAYSVEAEQRLAVGEELRLGDYTATLVGIEERSSDRRSSVVAQVALADGGRELGVREPMLSRYPRAQEAIGTPAVTTRVHEDAYLVLAGVDDARSWAAIRLIVNPLVAWLWIAGGIMVVGAVLAAWPGRRRGSPTAQEVRAAPPTERAEVGA